MNGTTKGRRILEERRTAPPAHTPDTTTRASLLAALAEAVRDRDQRSLRRLLARLAEQVTVADLHALRDALCPRRHRGPGPR